MLTIVLLIVSNIFMTLAWYGHLKFPHLPMAAAIFIGWRYLGAFACLVGAAAFMFGGRA